MKNAVYAAIALSLFWQAPIAAQTTFTNDVSIKGGGTEDQLCIGDNCADDEVYASNKVKLRIKDENTAIEFFDVNSGDPNWILEANQGGANNFSIGNASSGTRALQIAQSARSSTMYLSDTNQVGIGTSLPQANLHITSGWTPKLRLEQDQSSGFFSHTWEISANNIGFFIDDINNADTPFTIRQGAPTNALTIIDGGNIGMGIKTPQTPLHIKRRFGTATDIMRLENNGGVVFRLKDTSPGGQEFTFQSNGGLFRIASPAVPGPEFTMDDFGNVTIKGSITTIGVCNVGCDRVFDEDYDLRPLPEHNALMWEQGHLPAVGPTAEDGPMNLSDKVGGMLNELEHAHIYIGQLHDRLEQQEKEKQNLEMRLSDQGARLAMLETALKSLTKE